MVGQLAVQMKDRSIERGGERIFVELLGERRKRTAAHRSNVLAFLARCLSAVQPRPSIVQELATKITDESVWDEVQGTPMVEGSNALGALLENSRDSSEPIASVLSVKISMLMS